METYSAEKSTFDSVACVYDEQFTHTPIGILQRERVRKYLWTSISMGKLRILEINCGTGEDALWLAEKGHEVMATDASIDMVKQAEKKIRESKTNFKVEVAPIPFNKLHEELGEKKFDLIFSDFGGLNCATAEELKELAPEFSSLLTSNGKLIAVIMGRKCLWEQFYFSVKGKFAQGFRRNSTKAIKAQVGNEQIATWYYSPVEFSKIFNGYFNLHRVKPVGLFIPPSYLNCFLADKKFILTFFNSLEKIFSFSWLSNYADHYYIELSKRSAD